jgi:peptidoglycan/xylan/chitin deacetylase (PgdA/CDA1 family)
MTLTYTRIRNGLVRRYRRYFVNSAIVLAYHRVSTAIADPWQLCVSPSNFKAQLTVLRQRGFRLFTMADLAHALATTGIPHRSAVITFDDGYADNLYEALPLLIEFESPATVFVTAGQIESGRDYWWDTLTRVLLETAELPSRLDPQIIGTAGN